MSGVYDFTAKNLRGQEVSLKDFEGQVLLIVNTASKCGFTPQYEALQALYAKHQNSGFSVLAFPCNQFGAQEPEGEAKIGEFCATVFGATFPLFAKIEVNGAGAHPLYGYLKQEKPGLFGIGRIPWNFTKFLIGRDGKPVARYAPITDPGKLEKPIERLL
ncbi:MAG TPA: glutathione peroxidase [Rhizomicrobium sp.]|nr:glutathione peroxidase [Rhizomicrobium sp.]